MDDYWTPSNNQSIFNDSSTSGAFDIGVDDPVSTIISIADRNNAWSAEQAQIQRDWQEMQNAKAMSFNSAEAAKNRDWQKMMSDTAHQREILDLQKAGLNPVLSASGGNGASVGSGATASGVTSAGAKGDTDESVTGAVMSWMANMLQAQTAILNTSVSAQASMANASMMAGANAYAAELASAASMYNADLQHQAQMSDPTRYAMSLLIDYVNSKGYTGATIGSSIDSALSQAGQYANQIGGKLKWFFDAYSPSDVRNALVSYFTTGKWNLSLGSNPYGKKGAAR